MFPESPVCTLYDDTKRNGFWVTGGEPGVIEVLKVWKWPIVHRSKFWPIYMLIKTQRKKEEKKRAKLWACSLPRHSTLTFRNIWTYNTPHLRFPMCWMIIISFIIIFQFSCIFIFEFFPYFWKPCTLRGTYFIIFWNVFIFSTVKWGSFLPFYRMCWNAISIFCTIRNFVIVCGFLWNLRTVRPDTWSAVIQKE